MRFLQLVLSSKPPAGPRDPSHAAKVSQSIAERIASGALLATGALGKRATAAARVIKENGEITVEDPPTGNGWMAAGGYSITEYPTKEAAIAAARETLGFMGDAVVELIQVSELHPPSRAMPQGVVPYLTIDGASEAAAFYERAFGAREVARMPAEDGKRLMHCHLEINGGALMLADHFPEMGAPPVQRSESYTMQLVVANGDAWWQRALAAGCTERLPFAVAPWGDKYGQLSDPYGVVWAINSPAAR